MKTRKRAQNAREVLAENLKRLRAEHQLSQEGLAEQAGFHRTYVSQVERCKTNISLDNLEKLATFLCVPTSVLLAEHDPPPPSAKLLNN